MKIEHFGEGHVDFSDTLHTTNVDASVHQAEQKLWNQTKQDGIQKTIQDFRDIVVLGFWE